MLKLMFLLLSFSFSLNAFENVSKGYSIQFPEQWDIKNNFMGLDAFATAPSNASDQVSEANISIIAIPLENDINLEKFYIASVSNLTAGLKEFKIVQTGNVVFDNFEGKMIIYNHTYKDELKLKVRQYFIVHNHIGYIITGTSTANEANKYMPTFEKSAKSLKLLKK